MMLKLFDSWPDVLAHVRAGGVLYYVPEGYQGPYRTIATVVPEANNLRLRCPVENKLDVYPSAIAGPSFIDKLYRWEARKAARH